MKIAVFPNLGNTCYLNSVLQSFIYNSKLKEIITQSDLPFVTFLKKIINVIDLKKDNKHTANVMNIQECLEMFSFKRFEQQDAHECIIEFLELLVKECPYTNQTELDNKSSWDRFNTSPFIPMYHGQTRTTIKCTACQNVKNIFEEFNSINLTINSKSLTDLFTKYLEKEIHEDADNLYFCDVCRSNQKYEKKISLYRLPENLIIVLKRYTFTGTKIVSEVTFDPLLKIRESMSSIVKDYELQSIINHTGNLYNGHYTSYVILNNECLFIDDDSVNIKDYTFHDCYILFYKSKI